MNRPHAIRRCLATACVPLLATAAAGAVVARAWRVDPAVVEHIGLIRRELAAPHKPPVPAWVLTVARGLTSVGMGYGTDPALAAETTIGRAHDPVWVLPGSYGACLVTETGPNLGAAGCAPAKAVVNGRSWFLGTVPYGIAGAKEQVLVGIAPDNDHTVTIHWTGGTSTTVPVRQNIYSVPIAHHKGWRTLTLNAANGAPEHVTGYPNLPPRTPPSTH